MRVGCYTWQPTRINTYLLCHQLCDLLARLRTGAAGIDTVRIAHLLAHISTVGTYLGAGLASIAVKRRIVLHEMCRCQAHLGAVEQHIHVLSVRLLASPLAILVSHLHTDGVTIQAILNALLHLYLAHRLP
jgi:hypothetical protein